MPQEFDRSLPVQSHLDPKVFADLVRVFKSAGIPHKSSYSNIIHTIVTTAWTQWNCAHFTTIEEALSFLLSEGFSVSAKLKGVTGKRLSTNMTLENIPSPIEPTTERGKEILDLLTTPESDESGELGEQKDP